MARRGGTSKARNRARAKATNGGRARARKLAATSVLGGLLLVPSMIATGPGLGILPVAATGLGSSPLPVPGDVLRMLAGFGDGEGSEEELGASGRLPEADTISPDLLAAIERPGPGPGTGAGPLATVPPGPLGIPGIVLQAYESAAQRTQITNPRCGVTWSVLAAIGRIESNHARSGRVDAEGTTVSPILGPQLSGGPGIAAISDSDDGRLDGDTTWDRAVGPMQFIPTTWARYASDGNGDGTASPHNVFDATLAAANYLCSGGGDLRDPAQLASAIFRYNHSESYVRTVLTWASAYAVGVTPLPTTPAPPVDPIGPPLPITEPPAGTPPVTTPPTTVTATTTITPSAGPTATTTQPPGTTETPTQTTTPTSPTTQPPSTSETTTSNTCAPTTTTTVTTTEPTPTTTTPPPGCPVDEPAASPSQETVVPSPSEPTSSLPST